MQYANLFQRHVPEPGPASYLTTGVYVSFELMVCSHGRSPNSSFLLYSLFRDALVLPQAAYFDFSRSREWEVAVGRYRALFAAFGIRSQDVLLRLTHRRLYIGLHVQTYLAGLDAEWEERSTRLTLGVQNALEEGTAIRRFPAETSPSPRRMEPVLERDLMMRGHLGQKGAITGTTESHQNARKKDTTTAEQAGTP